MKKIINEKLNIPDVYKPILNALVDYAIGFTLMKYTKNRIKNVKQKSPKQIVQLNILHNESKKLIRNGKQYFLSRMKELGFTKYPSLQLKSNFKLNFPEVRIKNSQGERIGAHGLYNPSQNIIEININIESLVGDYSLARKFIQDVVEHEFRHYLQFKQKYGRPKRKISAKSTFPSVAAGGWHHALKDVEFKTNVHTYANSIKNFLNLFFTKNQWLSKFTDIFIKNQNQTHPISSFISLDAYIQKDYEDIFPEIDRVREALSIAWSYNRNKWKQYIVEIYKELFSD
jgi:predicted SprT family Zn-dependent metalloprotease